MKYKLDWTQWVILILVLAIFSYFVWYSYGYNKEMKARPVHLEQY
jgi:hypothetical protein